MVDQIKIAITLQDDSLIIKSLVTNDYAGIVKEATPEYINSEILKSNLDAKSWRIIQDSDIIPDRTFRNAWKDLGHKLDVDMPKAREIHREHLRQARGDLLAQLDTEYLKADENNDNAKKQEIKQKKQFLRDITQHPAIETAQTPEELKNVWFDLI